MTTSGAGQDWLRPGLALLVAWLLAYRFALAHAAVAAVSRARLRTLGDEGWRRADRLAGVLARRDAVQATLRLGYGLAVVGVAGGAWALAAAVGRPPWLVGLAALAALTLGAELLPRLAAALDPEQTALRQARWIIGSYRLFGLAGRWLVVADGRDEDDDESAAESLRELVDTTPLGEAQRRRITDILEFPDKLAGEVMVPRIEMIMLPATTPLTEVATTIVESGFSRIPIYGASKDDVVGLAHARDVLARLPAEGTAGEIIRPAVFVGEGASLEQLLRELRGNQSSVAVVVDEYGGTAGMVTVEDLVEEIVGEIHDETDTLEQDIRPRLEGGWLISARTELDELAELLDGEEIEGTEANTVGGLAVQLAGDLPAPGEVLLAVSESFRVLLLTLAVEDNRVQEVAAVVQPRTEPGSVRPPELGEGPWRLPADLPLAAVAEALRLESGPTGGATLGDLLAFWPADRREVEVLWNGYKVSGDEASETGERWLRLTPVE